MHKTMLQGFLYANRLSVPGRRIDPRGNEIMNLFSKLREWRLYSKTVEKLRQCFDRNLTDMGISRTDIPAIARRSVRAIRYGICSQPAPAAINP